MLATPLNPQQIEGAVRIRQQLPQWQQSDAALLALRDNLPGFEPEVCLLKAVAVNSIYGTNVLAIVRVAKHVLEVLGHQDRTSIELVVEIANPPAQTGRPHRKHTSFASKFCHFFVDAERFPIYDDAACQALKLHFGKAIKAHDYPAFCSRIDQLKALLGKDYSSRMIDHYLWLTGMYMRWLKERKMTNPKVNEELRELFESPTKEQSAELDALLPTVLDRAFRGQFVPRDPNDEPADKLLERIRERRMKS